MSEDTTPPTRIRATCPQCGEVELTPPDVELRVCQVEERSHYAFVCPECYRTVSKPADRRVVRLLTSGGVPAQPWDPPEEALEPRNGPALTWDDLLDLHLELESPDWWARLQAARALRDPAR
jgi:predicted RNA-binding Zn-ribbon protein involved in translation (DUF1610 family)